MLLFFSFFFNASMGSFKDAIVRYEFFLLLTRTVIYSSPNLDLPSVVILFRWQWYHEQKFLIHQTNLRNLAVNKKWITARFVFLHINRESFSQLNCKICVSSYYQRELNCAVNEKWWMARFLFLHISSGSTKPWNVQL